MDHDKQNMKSRGFGQLAAVLFFTLFGAVVDAACLDIDAASSPCRYPAGDAWCARNDGANLYAYKDGCVDEGGLAQAETPARARVKPAPGDPVAVWDCAKARTVVERVICANPDIRAQDARMGALYAGLQALGLSPERMQKAWLRDERSTCDDADCLRGLYFERILYFESLVRPGAAAREAVRVEAGTEPVAPLVRPPAPDTKVDPNPVLLPATEPASTDFWASSSEPTSPADGPAAFLPELPQPELPSSFSGDDQAVGGIPVSADAGAGLPDHQSSAFWMGKGLVVWGIAALISAIGLFAWVRRFRLRGAIALSRDRLAILIRRLQAVSAGWFAEARRIRAPRLASARVSEKGFRPTEPRLSDEILERLLALARPGESLSSVLGRAVAALETASDQPPETAVLSRMAALEARLAQLEADGSTPNPPLNDRIGIGIGFGPGPAPARRSFGPSILC